MNAFAERFIGSARREAFNWFILFNETQIRNILAEYIGYYNEKRPHRNTHKKYQKDISRKNKGILSRTQFFPVCIIFLIAIVYRFYYYYAHRLSSSDDTIQNREPIPFKDLRFNGLMY